MAATSRASWPLKALSLSAGLWLAAAAAGCSSIQTPLPDLAPAASSSLTQDQKNKAMADLARKAQTHEQDAEHQIEQAR